jgi:hypothetical protein
MERMVANHRLDKHRSPEIPEKITAVQAVNWAEQHLFERRSVVHEHELWRHALEHLRGQDVSLAEIQAVTRKRDYIRDEQFQGKITTREVLQRELNIVRLAQHQMNQYEPLAANYRRINRSLDDEQRKAVEHILSSRDFVTLFRGGAGTGKSYTLREVKAGLAKAGHVVHVLAPQRQQVADLERDGFTGAQTVSAFLTRRSMRAARSSSWTRPDKSAANKCCNCWITFNGQSRPGHPVRRHAPAWSGRGIGRAAGD